jgi:O-antigen/teichoic acid export membrane protein
MSKIELVASSSEPNALRDSKLGERTIRPRRIKAFICIDALVLLSEVIRVIVWASQSGPFLARLASPSEGVGGESKQDDVVDVAVALVIAILLIAIVMAANLVFGVSAYKGANWGRIAYSIQSGLWIAFCVLQLATGVGLDGAAIGVVVALTLSLVLLWTHKRGSDFFRQGTAR